MPSTSGRSRSGAASPPGDRHLVGAVARGRRRRGRRRRPAAGRGPPPTRPGRSARRRRATGRPSSGTHTSPRHSPSGLSAQPGGRGQRRRRRPPRRRPASSCRRRRRRAGSGTARRSRPQTRTGSRRLHPRGRLDRAAGGLPVLVLEEALVELAGGVAGQLVAEVDRARALHVGEVLAAVGDQLLRPARGRRRPSTCGWTTALTSSPKSSLGTPKTATSATFGCMARTFSASCG